jgi:hypothetical protein
VCDSAGPSTPVRVTGFKAAPIPGEECVRVIDEHRAREIVLRRERVAKLRAEAAEQVLSSVGEDGKIMVPLILKVNCVQRTITTLTCGARRLTATAHWML